MDNYDQVLLFFLSHYVEDYITVVVSRHTGALMYSCKTALVERIGVNMCCQSAHPDVNKSVITSQQ